VVMHPWFGPVVNSSTTFEDLNLSTLEL